MANKRKVFFVSPPMWMKLIAWRIAWIGGMFLIIRTQWVRKQSALKLELLNLIISLFTTVDAHAPASLLKLWYRELYDPLIPDDYYEDCVNTEDPDKAKEIVNKLPQINQLVSLP